MFSGAVTVKTVSEDSKKGVFEIEGLFAGYGLTAGNALRRTLLSSLPGASITEFKVKNAPHEFSTLPGVKEALVELLLNFKSALAPIVLFSKVYPSAILPAVIRGAVFSGAMLSQTGLSVGLSGFSFRILQVCPRLSHLYFVHGNAGLLLHLLQSIFVVPVGACHGRQAN